MNRLEEQPTTAPLFRFWVFYCFIFYGTFPLFTYEFELILTKIVDSMILLKSMDILLHVTMVFKFSVGATDLSDNIDPMVCCAKTRFVNLDGELDQ